MFGEATMKQIMAPILRWRRSRTYNPQAYWENQLGTWGRSLWGPGRGDISEAENVALYKQGELSLKMLFEQLGISSDKSFAEIGSGNGYWTRWLSQRGVTSYAAFDITDVLFGDLRKEFPTFSFSKRDVTREGLGGTYDVLLMIDVTQHIVDERLFSRAMQNCSAAVKPGSHFIVTSWLRKYERVLANEVFRSLDMYVQQFPQWNISEPLPFRDKFLLGFSKPVHL